MRRACQLLILAAVSFGILAGPASAQITVDESRKMSEIFTSPNQATNSDLAFWGDHAFVGYYTGDTGFPAGSGSRGGVRIFDISNPSSPQLVRNFACDANQNDPIVWDRNGNGVPDLLLLAVDRTMANPNCGAPRSAHDDRNGWEGVRIFEMSDDPANPFQTITPLKMQYTDCGAHTITAWTGFAENAVNPRLIVYVASYPLRAGPTCGQANFSNVTNPYDEDKVVNDPLHRQIQVLSVPLNNPAATTEIAAPRISYPGDPDGQDRLDRAELHRARAGGGRVPRHRGAHGAQPGRWRVRRAGPGVGDRPEHRDPEHRGPDDDRRRRGHLRRHGPVPRSGRLLPLGDVQQRRHGRELGRRVVRLPAAQPAATPHRRLSEHDDLPAPTLEPAGRAPQERSDVLHRHGRRVPERVPRR